MNTEIKLMVSSAKSRGDHDSFADFVSPSRRGGLGISTEIWAADNGAFAGFDREKFLVMLDAIERRDTRPAFVVLPDVVGDHRGTVESSLQWFGELKRRGLKSAFVLQDTILDLDLPPEEAIPWSLIDAIFIGGSTEFKFHPWVRRAVRIAKLAGFWVHMGRVNSVKRLRYAMEIGVDSVDGTGLVRFADNRERMIRFIEEQREHQTKKDDDENEQPNDRADDSDGDPREPDREERDRRLGPDQAKVPPVLPHGRGVGHADPGERSDLPLPRDLQLPSKLEHEGALGLHPVLIHERLRGKATRRAEASPRDLDPDAAGRPDERGPRGGLEAREGLRDAGTSQGPESLPGPTHATLGGVLGEGMGPGSSRSSQQTIA